MSEAGNVAKASADVVAQTSRAPGIDASEAARLMEAARRSYAIAELVQERRMLGNVDSAVPAHRALTLLLRLVLRLSGEPLPDDFAELSVRARAIAVKESLLAEDRGGDLALIAEMRRRVIEGDSDVTGAEDRSYDRALVRSAEWFDGVQSYLDEFFGRPASRWRSGARVALGAAVVFAFGILIGRHVRPEGSSVMQVPAAPNADLGAAATAQPQNVPPPDVIETPARLLVTDTHFACSGCWPREGALEAPYAWTSGKADMVVRGLIARRRYHVVLGIADPGHVDRVGFEQAASVAAREVGIQNGLAASPEPVTADDDGVLRFTVRVIPWKPADHVKGSHDTRELGIAIADVRLEEAAMDEATPAASIAH